MGSLVFRMYEECRVKPAQIPGRIPFGETHLLQRAFMECMKDLRRVSASLGESQKGSEESDELKILSDCCGCVLVFKGD
jgi:hypothetical protein